MLLIYIFIGILVFSEIIQIVYGQGSIIKGIFNNSYGNIIQKISATFYYLFAVIMFLFNFTFDRFRSSK